MPYPEKFYYNQKQSEPLYGSSEPGTLDVNRMLHGLPPFKKPILASQRQPKTLVLADWTAANWSTEKIEKVIQAVTTGIEDGFSIYVYSNSEKKLILLNKENVEDRERN